MAVRREHVADHPRRQRVEHLAQREAARPRDPHPRLAALLHPAVGESGSRAGAGGRTRWAGGPAGSGPRRPPPAVSSWLSLPSHLWLSLNTVHQIGAGPRRYHEAPREHDSCSRVLKKTRKLVERLLVGSTRPPIRRAPSTFGEFAQEALDLPRRRWHVVWSPPFCRREFRAQTSVCVNQCFDVTKIPCLKFLARDAHYAVFSPTHPATSCSTSSPPETLPWTSLQAETRFGSLRCSPPQQALLPQCAQRVSMVDQVAQQLRLAGRVCNGKPLILDQPVHFVKLHAIEKIRRMR